MSEKQRMIQEYVLGKQITLAHVIANPDSGIYIKLGLPDSVNSNAIGILTITSSEAALAEVLVMLGKNLGFSETIISRT